MRITGTIVCLLLCHEKSTRILILHQWASTLLKTPAETLPQRVALSLSTTGELSSALSLLDLWPTDAEESRLLSLAPCGLYSVQHFKLRPTTSPGCAVPELSLALALERLIVSFPSGLLKSQVTRLEVHSWLSNFSW